MQKLKRPGIERHSIIDNTKNEQCDHIWRTFKFDNQNRTLQICEICRARCAIEFNTNLYRYIRNYRN